jgi:hypothetical protein
MSKLRFQFCVLMLAICGSLLVGLSTPASALVDRDCSDFRTQRAAQIFFLEHGGPRRDPHRLDGNDNDGRACESNPCPCYYGSRPPGGSGPAPARPEKVRTEVNLATPTRSAITGESVTLRASVTPKMVRKVVLQRRNGARWVNVASGRTSRKGKEAFHVSARKASTSYRVVVKKLRARGTIYLAGTSLRRTVRTVDQTVTLKLSSTTAEPGEEVTAHVASTPIRSGRTVILQLRAGGVWTRVDAARMSPAGTATFTVAAADSGTYRYRAVATAYRGAPSVASNKRLLRAESLPEPDLTAPPTPTGFQSTVDDTGVLLSWNPVDAPDLAGYKVYLRTSAADSWVLLGTTASSVTTFNATGHLTDGVEKSFAVTAIDSSLNESEMSSVVTVVPTAPVVP